MEDFNKASTQVMLGVNITQLGASEPLLPDLDAPPCPHRAPLGLQRVAGHIAVGAWVVVHGRGHLGSVPCAVCLQGAL